MFILKREEKRECVRVRESESSRLGTQSLVQANPCKHYRSQSSFEASNHDL